MGQQEVKTHTTARQIRLFEQSLLKDIRALEHLLGNEMIESDVNRIGAEQELFLVDHAFRPAPLSLKIIEEVNNPHITTELGSFNLEFNLDPIHFEASCFSEMENQMMALIAKVRTAAQKFKADVVLTGILPTLRKGDLGLHNLTPKPRYFALNEAMNRLRVGDYELFLRGTDELYIRHDSVMLEACNASFQVHFQVSAENFAKYYNIAQAVAGPVLAVSENSPLLFGKRLWHETRIAVFQQSIDTRHAPRYLRESLPRVHFGRDWVQESVLEIFKEDIARFPVLLGAEIDEDPDELLQQGCAPCLKALQLHNSTIYRWNRPCYGLTDGKPHLRIENRVFPSGPSVVDEVANAAFWLGLIKGLGMQYEDIRPLLHFDDVRSNFYAAARRGLKAQFNWIKKKTVPAHDLVRKELLPLSRAGLQAARVDQKDIDRLLGIIKKRVSTGQTGSHWMLNSFQQMRKHNSKDECQHGLTKTLQQLQQKGKPVHSWPVVQLHKHQNLRHHYQKIEQIMTTDLFTVNEETTVDMVLTIMDWRRIRHLPVEDNKNRLVGVVNYRSLVLLLKERMHQDYALIPISSIMQKDVPTVTPETATLEAIALMKKKGVSCLPVIDDEQLVGIVTEHDFMNLAGQFLG